MIALDPLETAACAGVALGVGALLVRAVPPLGRYNVPGPVVGGLAISLFLWAFRTNGELPVRFDTALQQPLMIAFFTTVGFGAGVKMLRAGGAGVVKLFLACTLVAVLQNVVGASLAVAFGLPSLLGVLAGSVTLTGGPGTGLAFAPAFEAAGVRAAGSVALVAALGGIVLGGVVGGPVGTRLITRDRLVPSVDVAKTAEIEADSALDATTLLRHLVWLLVAMALGAQVSAAITRAGITLPPYIGAMLVATALRNVDDATGRLKLNPGVFDLLGGVALSLFLALSLMTLKLWELAGLALPLLVILVVQTAVVIALALVPMYRLMGRDYDAAVASAGFCGFMLGTTANAMANMDALARRYGPAPRAFLVVPLVGASLIDTTNALIITACLNLLR